MIWVSFFVKIENRNNRVCFFNFLVGEEGLDEPENESRISQSMKDHHKMRANRWKLVEYDSEAAWSYFIGTKAAYDFACMKNILSEIKIREETFQPKTLLDFGSGLGTVTW